VNVQGADKKIMTEIAFPNRDTFICGLVFSGKYKIRLMVC